MVYDTVVVVVMLFFWSKANVSNICLSIEFCSHKTPHPSLAMLVPPFLAAAHVCRFATHWRRLFVLCVLFFSAAASHRPTRMYVFPKTTYHDIVDVISRTKCISSHLRWHFTSSLGLISLQVFGEKTCQICHAKSFFLQKRGLPICFCSCPQSCRRNAQ